MRSVAEQFEQYARLNKKIAPDIPVQVGQIEEPSRLADAVAANLNLKVSDKQTLLSAFDPQQRLERSEEHTSELQSLMRISYAVFCLKKKNNKQEDTLISTSTN